MAYQFPNYYPIQYQDQLNQLRNMSAAIPGQNFQMQPRQEQPAINWVQGEAGAKSWFVAPGATVLLMDSETQKFYLKTADISGVPQLRTFEYTEVGAQKPAEPKKYITEEEFAGFRDEVLGKLSDLSASVEVSTSRKKKGEANE